jgi:hypothetical protein
MGNLCGELLGSKNKEMARDVHIKEIVFLFLFSLVLVQLLEMESLLLLYQVFCIISLKSF